MSQRPDNPRNVVVSTCLRAILTKLLEKSKTFLKQDSFHYSSVFSFHFLLLLIGSPLKRDLSCSEVLCLLSSLLVSAFLSTILCTHLSIIRKKIKFFIKFTQELERLAPSSSNYQSKLTLEIAVKTINKQTVFLKLFWERDFLYFLLCQTHSDTWAPLGVVCLQNDTLHLITVSIWLSFNICYCFQRTKKPLFQT
jgi:hypothetical protein